ncbi:MAG: ribonuclease III [Kiloniellales bacterium]|nr:ribonuclease III [Kiloniellales bacterium]
MGSSRTAAPADLQPLTKTLGHDFADPRLLSRALTHGSAPRRQRGIADDYQRLEFVGDRVLGLIIAERLYRDFPREREGALAKRFAMLVRREALAEVAGKIGLGSYITISKSEEDVGGRENPAILADCCEALIGALFLDGGLVPARRFVEAQWQALIEADRRPPEDAKTALQEWAQARALGLPVYQEVERRGPDHDPFFTVEVSIEDRPAAQGSGRSKRLAEQEAAARLLEALESEA